MLHQLVVVSHQHHVHLRENEVQHDSFSGYVPTKSDAENEEFLADNLSGLSDQLLTSTVKNARGTSTKQVQS